MSWQDFQGNRLAIDRIRRMLSTGRLPHALLFAGPAGVGKTMAAELMAAELLQTSKDKLAEHPDFIRVEPEGSRILIGQIRELQRVIALAPLQSENRFCLIEPADSMEAPAANCLLKILEEPPAGVVFGLITAFPHSLLSTIRSRTAEVRFVYDPELQKTREWTKENNQPVLQWLQALPDKGLEWVWPATAALEGLENTRILDIIRHWIYLLRDLAMITLQRADSSMLNGDCRKELVELASGWEPSAIAEAICLAEASRRQLQRNANSRLVLEALLIRTADLYWGGKKNADHCGSPV